MRRRHCGGFAYIWTLMLIGFMGASLVIGSELYATAARRDKEAQLLFVGHEFRQALGRYHEAKGAGGVAQYPLTLEELLKDPRYPGAKRHLRRLYADPVTGKAEWGLIRQQGRIVGVHSLSELQPIKQGGFHEEDRMLHKKARYADWLFTYPADMFTNAPPAGPNAPAMPNSAPPKT
ncbi:type II secretion system protein [Pseudoduganella namucuonensis]|uniref:Type II secretion system protein n=1 Tax=Pseudoduganella namucuonensis TaxID=1035707 RepID=A0A1I7JWM4_9BURK|nr:type II secretion system protein [Pseudoduganella namucuonensis]SFU89515.1 hypothetical protein SAMN05216552_1013103 [Pseudoduganella namucuonensis]